jgi:hypothetical protein
MATSSVWERVDSTTVVGFAGATDVADGGTDIGVARGATVAVASAVDVGGGGGVDEGDGTGVSAGLAVGALTSSGWLGRRHEAKSAVAKSDQPRI